MTAQRTAHKVLEATLDVTRLAPDAATRACPALLDFATRYAPCGHLDLGNLCNLGCVYCGLERDQSTHTPKRVALATLRAARRAGLAKLALVGGEPTIRRDLPDLVAATRAEGYTDVVLTTNGLLLADADHLDRLLAAGVTSVHLSLDDHDPARLAALCRHPDAGRLALIALDLLLARPTVHLFLYAVLTRPTLPWLTDHVTHLARWSALRGAPVPLILTAPKLTGRARENAATLLAPLPDVAAAIAAAHARATALGVPIFHRNVPDELLPGWSDRALEAALVEGRMELR
jgi:molybdenum cofactor biosynthesis enzyme MoaA